MRKTMMMAVLLTMLCSSPIKAQNEVNIGKSNIKLSSKMLTPEALWAMGRISGYAASPDGVPGWVLQCERKQEPPRSLHHGC